MSKDKYFIFSTENCSCSVAYVCVFFHCFPTSLVSWCSLRECASFTSQGQVDSSLKQIPALPVRVSRVYRLYQLPLPFPSGHYSSPVLTSAFAPTPHALPTSVNTETMSKIEDSGDKDFQLGLATFLMLGGLIEGGVFREAVTIVWKLESLLFFFTGIKQHFLPAIQSKLLHISL